MKLRLLPAAAAIAALPIVGCAPAAPRTQTEPRADVTAQDIEQRSGESIESLLQRKASGLIVKNSPDGISVLVRGQSSFSGADRPPLYVLDGSPFSPGPGGVLSGVDPYSIESIRLLRGADAGLYGIDGANGVILITTKRGTRPKP